MYQKYFGLQQRPFPPAPEVALYYPSSVHEAALAALTHGLADEEGLILLTGEPGLGKTLLGQLLLARLPEGAASAFLAHARLPDRLGLLQAIAFDLGLPHEGTENALRLRLTEALLTNCAEDRRTVVVIDEAHYLHADLLEELRLLGNLHGGGRHALQVVLLAQPSILDTLHDRGLASLRQRLAVRAQLAPLSAEEAFDYVKHQVRACGGDDQIFDDGCLGALVEATAGIPRLLNRAAHLTLALACQGELRQADSEAALEALGQLELSAAPEIAGAVGLELGLTKRSA